MIHLIVGGGPAGIFAALRCKEIAPDSHVIVLEKTNQLLSKVRISGGGRCNVTHHCFDPIKLSGHYPRGSKELLGPFNTFQPKDMIAWLKQHGVDLKTEDDGRIFPESDSSQTIIDCLLNRAAKLGVDIRKQQRITSIQKNQSGFLVTLPEETILSHTLLLATGSSSWGYDIAKELGHTLIDPVPSLFTFNTPSSPLLDLSGIAVQNVILSLENSSLKQQGSILLTHWGFSGPAALKLSAWAAILLHQREYQSTLFINWLAADHDRAIYERLLAHKKEFPLQTLPTLLPRQLFNRLLTLIDLPFSMPSGQIPNKKLSELALKLYADPYLVLGKTTHKQEFVTAGGIHLKEVNFKTMQSRLIPHLFFAGEILNIDGVTGGFNFQNCWTSGWLAGTAMGRSV